VRGFHSLWWPEGPCRQVGNLQRVGNPLRRANKTETSQVKIAEIFYSIQGEGVLAGVPSIFIRTSGCNLRCVWCDTPYTSWQPEGDELSIDEILARVDAYTPARHLVLTGGEPMISPLVVELTEGLRARGLHVTIETAGTVFRPVACDLMSISPKLAHSTPPGSWATVHERLRIQPEALRRLMDAYEYQLKFVVAGAGDLDEIRRLIDQLAADRSKVILMPEGIDPEILRERGRSVAEICKQEGFRFGPRVHVDLYGNTPGT
jgi:7-carboxy-7-deazaguanine synthase